MTLIRQVYAELEGGIHELQVQNTIQRDVLNALQYVYKLGSVDSMLTLGSASFPSVDLESLHNELTDILSSVIEVAHSRASKILF